MGYVLEFFESWQICIVDWKQLFKVESRLLIGCLENFNAICLCWMETKVLYCLEVEAVDEKCHTERILKKGAES